MVSFNDWVNASDPFWDEPINFAERAEREWFLINRNPYQLIIHRGSTVLPAQTVSINYPSAGEQATAAEGKTQVFQIMIYGVRGHPRKDDEENPVPDTDIKAGDRFFDTFGRSFKVETVSPLPGKIEVTAHATK